MSFIVVAYEYSILCMYKVNLEGSLPYLTVTYKFQIAVGKIGRPYICCWIITE